MGRESSVIVLHQPWRGTIAALNVALKICYIYLFSVLPDCKLL